jgi:hypothetical protein
VRAIIFSGPSLPPSSIADRAGLTWRPPLRQGDLHRAVLEGATALGVIDGVFETTPTVWHDEILFALDRRIPVYGAASIGALRAAELHSFGMKGVGRIFEWFRDGILEDDDEVAMLHGPPELDFVHLTVAMVDIRASVQEGVDRGLIDAATASEIVAIAKGTFYKQRTWDSIFERMSETPNSPARICEVRRRLAAAHIDLKRSDARLLLDELLRSPAIPR